MKILLKALVIVAIAASFPAAAQQSRNFGDYVVHYNALQSSLITPEVAIAYGIRRSDSRALVNVSVLKNDGDETPKAIPADVAVTARNLTGQTRTIQMKEITEGESAIYYIGEFSVRNLETFDFIVEVTPKGRQEPFELKFRQQFFTE